MPAAGDIAGPPEGSTVSDRSYLDEFRVNFRALAAATLGMATGYSLNNYLNNLFIPTLMKEFSWSSAQISLLGTVTVLSVLFQPLLGRLTDVYGARVMAAFGLVATTAVYLALSIMSGSFLLYFLITAAQVAFVASTTGPVVYSRLIAENYRCSRGVALAIATCAYSVAGGLAVPFVAQHIDQAGWRDAYRMVALWVAAGMILAILLIPRSPRYAERKPRTGCIRSDFVEIVRTPALKLIAFGIFLCSLTIITQTTQLKVILQDNGLASDRASYVISIYAVGVIAGRLICGAALDRFPPHLVAATTLGMPAAGLAILGLGMPGFPMAAAAVLLLGMGLGAEGDIGGFLAMTYFRQEVYSTVLGIIIGALGIASALGSLLLSLCLASTSSFAPFLLFASGCALLGAYCFWLLRAQPAQAPAAVAQA
jgi:MFS family permease